MRIELFHEIYSSYYCVVHDLVREALHEDYYTKRSKGRKSFYDLVRRLSDQYAFAESKTEIEASLREGNKVNRGEEVDAKIQAWPLFEEKKEYYRNNLRQNDEIIYPIRPIEIIETLPEELPLSLIEKRWLKSISLDPRIKLFCNDFPELKDIEPLFYPEDMVVFDKYADGDPFENKQYIDIFRKILISVQDQSVIKIVYYPKKGNYNYDSDGRIIDYDKDHLITTAFVPDVVEYSERDDKFRLIGQDLRSERTITINISNIINVENIEDYDYTVIDGKVSELGQKTPDNYIKMELIDGRNALERVMLHFSHYKKEVRRRSENKDQYTITLWYDDEKDLVIRILSFGPMIKVTEPKSFVELLSNKLKQQKNLPRLYKHI